MHTLSKLVLCIVMLRGRHRGLPVALDRAVLMPSEFLAAHSPPQAHTSSLQEKGVQHGVEQEDTPRTLQDPDEIATRMRMRTRTISLQVESRDRESIHGNRKEKEHSMLPWSVGHISKDGPSSSNEDENSGTPCTEQTSTSGNDQT